MDDPIKFYADGAATYAERNGIDAMSEDYVALLDTFIARVDGQVLDAGCGHGRDVDYFNRKGVDAVGVDAAEPMIDHAKREQTGEFHVMNIRNLTFSDDSFDGVWCNSVLIFFTGDELEQVMDELVRVLRPDGILYAGFKEGEGAIEREKYGDSVTQYLLSDDQARSVLERAGLQVLEQRRSTTVGGFDALNYFCRKD